MLFGSQKSYLIFAAGETSLARSAYITFAKQKHHVSPSEKHITIFFGGSI